MRLLKYLTQILQAMHPFTAASEKELSLSVGDYVVVRKVILLSPFKNIFVEVFNLSSSGLFICLFNWVDN